MELLASPDPKISPDLSYFLYSHSSHGLKPITGHQFCCKMMKTISYFIPYFWSAILPFFNYRRHCFLVPYPKLWCWTSLLPSLEVLAVDDRLMIRKFKKRWIPCFLSFFPLVFSLAITAIGRPPLHMVGHALPSIIEPLVVPLNHDHGLPFWPKKKKKKEKKKEKRKEKERETRLALLYLYFSRISLFSLVSLCKAHSSPIHFAMNLSLSKNIQNCFDIYLVYQPYPSPCWIHLESSYHWLLLNYLSSNWS